MSIPSEARLLRQATYASVATALALIGAKATAWLLTGSVSVLASLVDSLMDVAASLINLFAVAYSLKPADEEHRFGHGKSESLAGLAQTLFIAGSATFLVVQAVDRILLPRPLEDLGIGLAVMGFAIVATLLLVSFQRHVVRVTGSTAIRADSLHYVTDLLTNLGTAAALGLAAFGWSGLDPVFALIIAAYILYNAWEIGHDAFQVLMDRELPEAIQDRIRALVHANPRVLGVHDLRTRQSGRLKIIQLHLDLDGSMTLQQAHDIAEEVEAAIHQAFPGADVVIHQDPVTR